MKVYFVRHGKTEYNIKKIIQGNIDVPLSDIGREEIQKFKTKIHDMDFDLCISSPYSRARETAEILVGSRCAIITNDLLKERHVGKLEGTNIDNYDIKKYWDINYETDELDIETPKELIARAQQFIDYIKENYENKSILVVAHGDIITAIHYAIVGYDKNTDLTKFHCEHSILYDYDL